MATNTQLQTEIEQMLSNREPDVEVVLAERAAPGLVRVVIDHPGGVDLDLCERVTDYYLSDRYPGSGHVGPSEQVVRADVLEAMAFVARLFPDETLQAP